MYGEEMRWLCAVNVEGSSEAAIWRRAMRLRGRWICVERCRGDEWSGDISEDTAYCGERVRWQYAWDDMVNINCHRFRIIIRKDWVDGRQLWTTWRNGVSRDTPSHVTLLQWRTVYVRTHRTSYARTHTHVHSHVHTHTHTYTYARTYVRTRTHPYIHTHINVHTHINTFVRTYAHPYTNCNAPVYTSMYTRVDTHACAYKVVPHTHTHTHAYAYTHVQYRLCLGYSLTQSYRNNLPWSEDDCVSVKSPYILYHLYSTTIDRVIRDIVLFKRKLNTVLLSH